MAVRGGEEVVTEALFEYARGCVNSGEGDALRDDCAPGSSYFTGFVLLSLSRGT